MPTGKKIKKEIQPKVRLTLVVGDKVFRAEKDTIGEALEKIYKDSFGFVKTWCDVSLEKGGKKAQVRYRPIQLKRALVGGRFAKDLLAKRLEMRLK